MGKVLLTGGCGFIGSEVARQLVPLAERITILDNLAVGKRANLPEPLPDSMELVVADVRDRSSYEACLRDCDAVLHLACLGVRHSIHSPRENHEVNAAGTLELLRAAQDEGVGRFVYVSSSEVYGTARHTPMDESHPTMPATVYGASKLAGECYTRAYWQTYGLPTVVLRPFNTFGPRSHHEGDSGEVIPKFLLRCMADEPLIVFGDGEQTRDYSYVSDTAGAIAAAATAPSVVGETINIGAGKEISINRLADLVTRVVQRPDAEIQHRAPRPGDVLRLCGDAAKARSLLGYEPRVSLEDGLRLLKDWYAGCGQSLDDLLAAEVEENWRVAAS
jgi:UDP-glucose 4-epimerase